MGADPLVLKVHQPSFELSRVNAVYVNPAVPFSEDDIILLESQYLFEVRADKGIPIGSIGLSKIQREMLNKGVSNSTVEADFFSRKYVAGINVIKFSLEMLSMTQVEVNEEDMRKRIYDVYLGFPFNRGQRLYIDTGDEEGPRFILTVEEMVSEDKMAYGILDKSTEISLSTESRLIKLLNNTLLTRKDFSLPELGIGGLKAEFEQIFRRAFVQRLFEPEVIDKFGFANVKGIMLHGPPGTGKTLIARKLGALLDARPPKIVNGPEILNKYVGQSEENIRNLFKDAEEEYRRYGAKSKLHIIIFDEIDAICKRRGTSGSSGAGDQVVNQLLSKLDGVEALDNILVVGMTNRLDMIDEALLRPGRFEIHLEISLPDENARQEIFAIHTKKMSQNSLLDDDVSLKELASMARNYTGAEISAVVRSACSFALERQIELRKAERDTEQEGNAVQVARKEGSGKAEESIRVTMDDLVKAMDEVRPAFGVNEDELVQFQRIFYETQTVRQAMAMGRLIMGKLSATNLYRTTSLLLYGANGTGKTSLAVRMARQSGFPFIKIISPRHLVGLPEYDKVNYIKESFMNAYKSEEACVILDDLEGLIEFVELGSRFSNAILQAVKIFTACEDKNKVCVIGTSSMPEVLQECGLFSVFVENFCVNVCTRADYDELCDQNHLFKEIAFTGKAPIKKLLALLPEADLSTK